MREEPRVERTQDRLRSDVAALCVTPLHRDVPGSLEAARAHCREQLEAVGWPVEERTCRPRPALRISDAGHPHSPLAMRWLSDLQGVNLLAVPDGRVGPQAGGDPAPGAPRHRPEQHRCRRNASGVAVALEVAASCAATNTGVVIALVDLGELWHWVRASSRGRPLSRTSGLPRRRRLLRRPPALPASAGRLRVHHPPARRSAAGERAPRQLPARGPLPLVSGLRTLLGTRCRCRRPAHRPTARPSVERPRPARNALGQPPAHGPGPLRPRTVLASASRPS